MYSSKIKDLISKAKNKRIGAIPVGLRVSFEGVKVSVEAQYEISGKVVIYLIGDGKNTIAKVDGSESGKKIAESKLYEYVVKDFKWHFKEVEKLKEKRRLMSMSKKFINELYIEVNVANGKKKYAVSTNMAIKNRVAASRKPVAKKPVAKKTIAKKTVAKKTATSSTGQKAYKYVYSKKKGSLVYAGTIKK
jgi:hypothetical protein